MLNAQQVNFKLGMILNFHSILFKNGVKRIVNKL